MRGGGGAVQPREEPPPAGELLAAKECGLKSTFPTPADSGNIADRTAAVSTDWYCATKKERYNL